MLKNYFKTALRSFRANKYFSLANIAGLAIGISAYFLLFLVVTIALIRLLDISCSNPLNSARPRNLPIAEYPGAGSTGYYRNLILKIGIHQFYDLQ